MQKRMKRLIAGLLVVVILSSVTLFTACENNENREHSIEYTVPGVTEPSDTPNTSGEITSGTCGDNLTWVLYRDGELVISGTGEMNVNFSNHDIPWGNYKNNIKTATIKQGVTSIGIGAFDWCTSLTSVTIGNSVTSIGDDAFRYCTSLASITIPDSVTSIEYETFSDCTSLASVTIGNSVTSIGREAFSNCTSLETVYYTGTEEQWNAISINWDNSCLTSANIIYSSP